MKGACAMEITDVRVRKVTKEGKMKAVVSITIDDEFVVHDIKVIEGEKGLFIAMPSRKASDGEYRDIAHPIKDTLAVGVVPVLTVFVDVTGAIWVTACSASVFCTASGSIGCRKSIEV